MRLVAITLCLSMLLVAACDDEDGDPSTYVSLDELEEKYKEAYCTYLAGCGHFVDVETCLSAQLTITGFDVDPNIEAAIYAGKVRYNGSNLYDCFEAIKARGCDKTSEVGRGLPAICRDFIAGTLMSGEACILDAECISGVCSGNRQETCGMGQCIGDMPPMRELSEIGEPCISSTSCVPGAYCDNLMDTCTALKPTGTTCQSDSECEYGLGCAGQFSTRTCKALPTLGQSCAMDFVCRDEGTYCNTTTNLCTQVGIQGAMCTSSSHCSTYYPCNFSMQQCTKGPSIGDPCSSSMRCFDAGTFCDFNTSTCVGLKTNGDECDNDQECASDLCAINNVGIGICSNPTVCYM